MNRQLSWPWVALVGLLLATAVAFFAIIRFDGFEAWPSPDHFEPAGWTAYPPESDPYSTCDTHWDDPAHLRAWDELIETATDLQDRLDHFPESETQHTDTRRVVIALRDRLLEIDRQIFDACAAYHE